MRKKFILLLGVLGTFLIILWTCKKIAIDKAHYHYKNDPEEYKEFKSSLLDWVIICPDTSRPNLYRTDLITDTGQFNWVFQGFNNNKCNGNFIAFQITIPLVDFNTNSLALIHAEGEGEFAIKRSKVLIDYLNKKILIKFLTGMVNSTDGFPDEIPVAVIIPKVYNDFELKYESYLSNL